MPHVDIQDRNEYLRKYREKNKEKISARARKNYWENREERLLYYKEYALKNKERKKEYSKKYNKKIGNIYYLKNKDKILEKSKVYHLKNKEDRNRNSKEYYRKNREKYLEKDRIKRRIKLGLPTNTGPLRNAKGTPSRTPEGYLTIYKPDHPNSRKNGRIAQHIYVMSMHLGRPLLKGETVHHKNGIRDDNHIENLKILTIHPPGQEEEDIINYYLPWFLVRGYELKRKSHRCGTNSAASCGTCPPTGGLSTTSQERQLSFI